MKHVSSQISEVKEEDRPSGAAPRWRSRAAVFAAILLLPPVLGIVYVGPAWPLVAYHFLVDGAILALWIFSVTGFGAVALRAVGLADLQAPASLRLVTAAACGLGILSLLILALGLAGWLNRPTAWLLVAIGFIAGAVSFHQWARTRRAQFRNWLVEPARWEALWLAAIPFLMLVLVACMAPPGTLWKPEPNGYDVVEYHLQVPREWFEAHRIVPLHHNLFSYAPFNVEMHFLLAMHLHGGPWAGMYLAQLMHAAFMTLVVLAVYGLLRWGTPAGVAILAALSLLSVPWIVQLAPIAYDEGGFLLFGTLAIGWAMRATFDSSRRLRRFALAGAMAGFAAGCKLTAVPEVLLAIPLVVFAIFSVEVACCRRSVVNRDTSEKQAKQGGRSDDSSDHRDWRRWGGILLFVIMGALTFSPWMARNIAWAGNPLFPELMPLLGHDGLSHVQVERWDRSLKPPPEQQPIRARLSRFVNEIILGWQFGYLLLPIGLLALLANLCDPRMWFLAGLMLILIVFWLSLTHLQARFLVLAAPIAALMLGDGIAAAVKKVLPLATVAVMSQRRPVRTASVSSATIVLAALALLIATFAGISLGNVNGQLATLLYGSSDSHLPGLIQPAGDFQPLGAEDLSWLTPEAIDLGKLPRDVTLCLIGDARAFVYQIPMTRLRYRTVFDVPDVKGDNIVQAWLGPVPATSKHWLLIDPAELRRFKRTYYSLPPIPQDVLRERQSYVVKQ